MDQKPPQELSPMETMAAVSTGAPAATRVFPGSTMKDFIQSLIAQLILGTARNEMGVTQAPSNSPDLGAMMKNSK